MAPQQREPIPEGNYERGKKLFKDRCTQCHVVDTMASKTGPTLMGVIGRTSGTVPGFSYSQIFAGLKKATDRADLITYLEVECGADSSATGGQEKAQPAEKPVEVKKPEEMKKIKATPPPPPPAAQQARVPSPPKVVEEKNKPTIIQVRQQGKPQQDGAVVGKKAEKAAAVASEEVSKSAAEEKPLPPPKAAPSPPAAKVAAAVFEKKKPAEKEAKNEEVKDQQQVQLEPKVAAEKKVLFAMWRPFTLNCFVGWKTPAELAHLLHDRFSGGGGGENQKEKKK